MYHCPLAEATQQYRPYGYGFGSGYAPRYGNQQQQMRVTAITDVDRRSSGLRVRGLIDSGMLYAMPGGDPRYRAEGDLTFRCSIDYRGRVYDVRIARNRDFRPPY